MHFPYPGDETSGTEQEVAAIASSIIDEIIRSRATGLVKLQCNGT